MYKVYPERHGGNRRKINFLISGPVENNDYGRDPIHDAGVGKKVMSS